jgi:hypothetical protein
MMDKKEERRGQDRHTGTGSDEDKSDESKKRNADDDLNPSNKRQRVR